MILEGPIDTSYDQNIMRYSMIIDDQDVLTFVYV